MAGTAAGDDGDVGAGGRGMGLGFWGGGGGSEGGRVAVDYFVVGVEEKGRVCEGKGFEGGEHGGGGVVDEVSGCCNIGE